MFSGAKHEVIINYCVTFDESGNYTVRPFGIDIKEQLDELELYDEILIVDTVFSQLSYNKSHIHTINICYLELRNKNLITEEVSHSPLTY